MKAKLFILDRLKLRRPLPITQLDWGECTSWVDFSKYYVVVEFKEDLTTAGSWYTANCTCNKFTACGTCQHVVAMYLRCGGKLTDKEKQLQKIQGFTGRTNNKSEKETRKRRPIILSEIQSVNHFFPSIRQADVPAVPAGDITLDESDYEDSADSEEEPTAVDAEEVISFHGDDSPAAELTGDSGPASDYSDHAGRGLADDSEIHIEAAGLAGDAALVEESRRGRGSRNRARINYAQFARGSRE